MAIRRSLRGEASKVLLRLGTSADIDDIIDKMDSIYGSVYPLEALLGQFYTARQRDDETAASWAMRLEEILSRAKNRRNIRDEDINDMLTSKFFDGLRPELKNIARYKKDTITDFDTLLKAVREIENQHNIHPTSRKTTPIKQATVSSTSTTVENKQIQQLTALVKQLSQDVKALKEERSTSQPTTNITCKPRDSYLPYQPDETVIYRPFTKTRHHNKDSLCWRCSQPGHFAIDCHVRLDHSRKTERALNLQKSYIMQQATQYSDTSRNNNTPGLLGAPNEVTVIVDGTTTKGLLDTGSTVSTISESFYRQNLSTTPMESLTYLLNIECADGKQLPYLGYIETDLQLPGSATNGTHPSVFLIVPDSAYHQHVPILIGTNVLAEVMKDTQQHYGQRYLQNANFTFTVLHGFPLHHTERQ